MNSNVLSVFLNALAIEMPQASLVGYDISPDQFPSEVPFNITLKVHDLSETFALEEVATYDFVHLRLIGQGLRPDKRTTAIANATSLLRHGGYLQWTEPDHIYSSSIISPPSSASCATIEGSEVDAPIMQRLFAFSLFHAVDLHWDRESAFACALRDLVIASGTMETIREEVVPSDWSNDPRARAIYIDNSLSIFRAALIEGLARGFRSKDLGLYSMSDIDRILDLAWAEMDGGDYRYRYWIHTVVGRKI